MGKQENIEQTIRILESIVERANIIHGNPDRELCLDIDLMLEDLRMLYRRYELLKKQCAYSHTSAEKKEDLAGHDSNNHSLSGEEAETKMEQTEDKPLPTDQAIPSFFTDTEEDTEKEQDQMLQDESAMDETPEKSEPKATPPVETTSMPTTHSHSETSQGTKKGSDTSSSVSPSDTGPGNMADTPARPETPNPGPPSGQPFSSDTHPGEQQESAPQSDKPAADASKGSNGKTVIDLFSHNPTPSIGDQFGRRDNSLHQRISSQKEDRSIGARLQQHPIDNIKDAIGLNEKFLFINELFNGDIQAYNEALAKLNSIGSLQQAFDYLNELTKSQHVDAKRSAETLEKLAGFVQRRYLNG